MSAPPYMNVYIADYTADVQALTCEQDGAYWRLLRAMWRAGGKLPNVPAKLATITGLPLERWKKVGPDVLALFERRGGSLSHKRITKELANVASKSEVRSEAGKKGAAEKAKKNSAKAQAIASGLLKQNPSISELELEEETPVVPKGTKASPSIVLRKSDIEAIWAATPRNARERTSKGDIERALQGAARRGHPPASVLAGVIAYYASAAATKDGGEFAKGAHRIIERDRWQGFVEGATPLEVLAAQPDPLAVWRKRVNAYLHGSRYWNTNDWEAEPGRPGCIVPAAVLAEFGFETVERAA